MQECLWFSVAPSLTIASLCCLVPYPLLDPHPYVMKSTLRFFIHRSLSVLANIEAAAIETYVLSPPTMVSKGIPS